MVMTHLPGQIEVTMKPKNNQFSFYGIFLNWKKQVIFTQKLQVKFTSNKFNKHEILK